VAVSASSQTAWYRPVNKGVQYAPLAMDAAACAAVEESPAFKAFLQSVRGLYEVALQQNETVDVVEVCQTPSLFSLLFYLVGWPWHPPPPLLFLFWGLSELGALYEVALQPNETVDGCRGTPLPPPSSPAFSWSS
jgi:hypothetical protein